ncbi:MAG TPA: preprotein translocase subunit YajC [Alphaproteobacteria bacterium]
MSFISPAYGQLFGGGGGGGGFDLIQLAPLALIFVVFYFLIIRPQQKKSKDHKAIIDALRRGDRVVTSGGIVGTVAKVVSDREISLEIADGVRVRAMRGMIAEVMARTEPASGDKADRKERAPKSDSSYYKVLGVQDDADTAAIETAYAAKASEPAAAEAYDTLKDPTKRKLYDRLGHDDYVATVKG